MLLKIFRPVSTWTADELRDFLERKSPDDYQLVDVRQPGEYREEHLPGAWLIPVGQLEERLGELDPGKPTIAY